MQIWTLGHSTRSFEALLALLECYGIERVADVRRVPLSRRHPHFAREALTESLAARGIAYSWLPGLGGRRSRAATSPHTALRQPAFAGYADHMASAAFEVALGELLKLAQNARTAILCAEARPEDCHRSLLSDCLTVRGCTVIHIRDADTATEHRLPPFARVTGGAIVYDGGQRRLPGF